MQNVLNVYFIYNYCKDSPYFTKNKMEKSPFRDFPKTFRILPIVITQKPPLKGF